MSEAPEVTTEVDRYISWPGQALSYYLGEMAIVDPTAGGNPIELTKARALEIFDRAMEGRV